MIKVILGHVNISISLATGQRTCLPIRAPIISILTKIDDIEYEAIKKETTV